MKRLLDPTFRYRPSFKTDIRKTFADFRKSVKANARPTPVQNNVTVLRALPRKLLDKGGSTR